MFTRTDSGLSNVSRFHRVDFVVYVEGRGDDEFYWSTVFGAFGSRNTAYKFQSLGDCQSVGLMCDKICSGKVKNSIAVMDSDFKPILSSPLQHSNILYSYGYSYENDLFSVGVATALFEAIAAGAASASDMEDCRARLLRGGRCLRRLVLIEIMYFMNHLPLLFNRSKSSGGIAVKKLGENPVDIASVRALLATARHRYSDARLKPTSECLRKVTEKEPLRWVFGHLVRHYVYQVVTTAATRVRCKKVTLDVDTFEGIAMSLLAARPSLLDKSIVAHYRKFLRSAAKVPTVK